jgi:uncharacterized protein
VLAAVLESLSLLSLRSLQLLRALRARQSLRKSLLVYAGDAASTRTTLNIPTQKATHPLPSVVLDTNAVLDWLVFANPGMAPVAAAIQSGAVRWLVCPRMRDELLRTLAYPALAKWRPDAAAALATFDQHAQMCPAPTTAPTTPRCTDADDQVFIDLAVAASAQCLLTHDRALLKLARRAKPLGLQIMQPALWQPHGA